MRADTALPIASQEAAVRKQVAYGKNAMPAFGGRLSDEDIAHVATYVIETAKTGWPESAGTRSCTAVLGTASL